MPITSRGRIRAAFRAVESKARAAAIRRVDQADLILAREVESRAPRGETGELAGSIRAIPARVAGDKVRGSVVIGGGHGGDPVEFWTEFGTEREPARPFIRPGFRAGTRAALAALKSISGT